MIRARLLTRLLLGAALMTTSSLMAITPSARAGSAGANGPPLSGPASHARPPRPRSAAMPTPPPRARGPVLWTAPASIDLYPIDAIACPATTLCVAVDRAGSVVTSTDPAGGARTWRREDIDGLNELTSISCPATTLCVATDAQGNIASSTNPAGGNWAVYHVDPNVTANNSDNGGAVLLRGVSCPTTSLCVAVDAVGGAFVSGAPTGSAGAWTPVDADVNRSANCTTGGLACQPPLVGVACPSAALCEAVDFSGNLLSTPTPTVGPWPSAPTAVGDGSLWGISCPTAQFCAIVNGPGQRVTTFKPGVPGSGRTLALPGALDGIWCESATLCLASAETGGGISGLLASTDPLARHPTWTLSAPGGVNAVGCPSPTVCIAADDEGNVSAGETTAAVAVALQGTLLTRPLPARTALARASAIQVDFGTAIAGRVSLTWTRTVGTQTTVLASASQAATAPGRYALTLRLTGAGRALLRDTTRRLTFTDTARFVTGNGALIRSVGVSFAAKPPPKPPRKKPVHRKRH